MNICFPVTKDEGMSSPVYNHFGSAPLFLVVDTESKTITAINNEDQHHKHGACNPTKALDGHLVDAIVVAGIGSGALVKLNAMGIRVHRAAAQTVMENLQLFLSGQLGPMTLDRTCIGHSPGGGCAH